MCSNVARVMTELKSVTSNRQIDFKMLLVVSNILVKLALNYLVVLENISAAADESLGGDDAGLDCNDIFAGDGTD